MTGRVLILGGTAEAREVAEGLHADGDFVITSLAGRVSQPRRPAGDLRVGGFGGPDALAAWLREHSIDTVLDATHPFAERISASAVEACERAGLALLRLHRPGWEGTDGPGDRWHWVDELEGAAALLPALGSRVLLTTGRQGLAAFAGVDDAWFLIRCVEPPDLPLPPRAEVVLDRGPYTLRGELALIDRQGLHVVVTKDSGGKHTAAKLQAARERGLPVILVRRPPRPATETVQTVGDALAVLRAGQRVRSRSEAPVQRATGSLTGG